MNATLKSMLRAGLLLSVFAVAGTSLVAFVHAKTKARIAANERAVLLRELHAILPESMYDADLLASKIEISSEDLGSAEGLPAYLAWKSGAPSGIAFTVIAPDGYGGPIKLLVGIDAQGTLTGVRTISHHETPGLGDQIDTRNDDWILGFTGRSLGNPPEQRWTVKRDGGDFDQFTGATITPRAVVGAIRRSLVYFRDHRDELFAAKPVVEEPSQTGQPEASSPNE